MASDLTGSTSIHLQCWHLLPRSVGEQLSGAFHADRGEVLAVRPAGIWRKAAQARF